MGLVSTWLNGIGLSSAVATFQAAGIVTPAALAELDVAHFEALGVSDPDDRRKLFYLVQRIKMAVSKDKKESVEEQVDAVISSTVPHDDDASEKKDERHTAATSRNRQMQHDHQANTVLESNGDLRRSRRLASKQEENPSSSKENQSLQSPAKPPGRGVEQRGATAPKSKTQASNKKDEDIDHLPKEEAKDSSPKARQTRQSKRRGITSSKANAVFNFADEDERVAEELAPVRISPPSRTSGLKKPTPINTSTSGSDGGSTSTDSVNKVQSPKSKSVKDRPLESKLQNPGKSLRTGKCLSAIPSQEVAPMSPLMDIPTRSFMDINQENNHSRRDSADSYCSGKLDDLLQSSGSDIDAEQGTLSDQDSVSIAPQSKPRTRPKSIGGSETSSRSKPRTNARNLSISQADPTGSTGSNRRKSEDIRKTFLASHPQSSHKLTTRATPFVQGGTHSESWATRVAHLREDNNAEHNLFRHQEDQQIYEYDMRIRVIVRKRPVNKVEASLSGGVDVIHPLDFGDYGKILVYQPKTRVDLTKEMETIPFAFDNVYDEVSTNLQIYQRSLRNLIQPFFRGQWSTVFAYGQTGSGKTYTMMGSNMTGINAGTATHDETNLGLYYLAALDIFEMVKHHEYQHLSVQVSLFEIYGGKLFDLLNARKQVKCLEDSKGKVCFPGLTEHPVACPDDLMELIEEGATNRSTGTTSRNADSSRSHAVLQLKLRKDVGRKKNVEHGRLNFIDLAGSERGADTSSSSRATRLEGAEINTSLLALKEVIRALATGGSMTHIPFRGSKLTQVLKDSFVGENSRCCMIACVSPDIGNCEQTLNTLRYADRVKERDAESGALSNGYEQPIRLQKLDLSDAIDEDKQSTEKPDWEEVPSNDFDLEDMNDFYEGDQSDADATTIDDLIVKNFQGNPTKVHEETPQKISSSKEQAGEVLISDHRSVMSKMLSMVKDEMIMVNKVDADRDSLDDYLIKLDSIQQTQLDLIAKLRGSLSNYVTACETPTDSNLVDAASDDESFEDLRD